MATHPNRALLMWRGLRADRSRPDLDSLRAEADPARFVWAVLPHAARSFAASIVVLREPYATAAAVAYLYCRILDTYEDLTEDIEERSRSLASFPERFSDDAMGPPPAIPRPRIGDDRDLVSLLLIEKCELIDAVYADLSAPHRKLIAELVDHMAAGMSWAAVTFERQGGVLAGDDQLLQYCRHVIGHPAQFVLHLLGEEPPAPAAEQDAWHSSELIQLANVTRDIEKDLERGIAYDPALRPYLGEKSAGVGRAEAIATIRRRLTGLALVRVAAFHRLFRGFARHRPSTRFAAVLMLLFTDRHYRAMARRVGLQPWPGPRSRTMVVIRALPALVVPAFAERIVARVAARSAVAAARLHPTGG